jgi:hypothetical protein
MNFVAQHKNHQWWHTRRQPPRQVPGAHPSHQNSTRGTAQHRTRQVP